MQKKTPKPSFHPNGEPLPDDQWNVMKDNLVIGFQNHHSHVS